MEVLGVALFFIGLVAGISTFISSAIDLIETKVSWTKFMLFGSLLLIIIGCALLQFAKEPISDITPLDVYRGNTELQVNYKVINNDTIVTDSIVIWK